MLVLPVLVVGFVFVAGLVCCSGWYFIKHISRTSAVSSTNFRSILIFVGCVVGTCNILESTIWVSFYWVLLRWVCTAVAVLCCCSVTFGAGLRGDARVARHPHPIVPCPTLPYTAITCLTLSYLTFPCRVLIFVRARFPSFAGSTLRCRGCPACPSRRSQPSCPRSPKCSWMKGFSSTAGAYIGLPWPSPTSLGPKATAQAMGNTKGGHI